MFRQFVTLFRGSIHTFSEDFFDRNALPMLQQQIRDSARAVASAKKAVALAMAQNRQEKEQYDRLVSRITELEERAISALNQEKHKLAHEAAETIAILESERDASSQALEQFSTSLDRLKGNVRQAEKRLRDLKRGERIAVATEKAQHLHQQGREGEADHLAEAEDTLKRLQLRQQQIDLTADALTELNVTDEPNQMIKKLAEAGCGQPQQTTAEKVLDRLHKQASRSSEN